MNKKEIARELVQALNILNDIAKEGQEKDSAEVRNWLDRYYQLLLTYHSEKK